MDNFNFWKLNDFDEREKCYKEKIEQLENDLDKERNIYEIDNKNSEIITNIKNEILSKEKQIQEIMEQNNKQIKEINNIKNERDENNKLINFNILKENDENYIKESIKEEINTKTKEKFKESFNQEDENNLDKKIDTISDNKSKS